MREARRLIPWKPAANEIGLVIEGCRQALVLTDLNESALLEQFRQPIHRSGEIVLSSPGGTVLNVNHWVYALLIHQISILCSCVKVTQGSHKVNIHYIGGISLNPGITGIFVYHCQQALNPFDELPLDSVNQ
jgi:hypothetical protein